MPAVNSVTFMDRYGSLHTVYADGVTFVVNGRQATSRASAVKLMSKLINTSEAESLIDQLCD